MKATGEMVWAAWGWLRGTGMSLAQIEQMLESVEDVRPAPAAEPLTTAERRAMAYGMECLEGEYPRTLAEALRKRFPAPKPATVEELAAAFEGVKLTVAHQDALAELVRRAKALAGEP